MDKLDWMSNLVASRSHGRTKDEQAELEAGFNLSKWVDEIDEADVAIAEETDAGETDLPSLRTVIRSVPVLVGGLFVLGGILVHVIAILPEALATISGLIVVLMIGILALPADLFAGVDSFSIGGGWRTVPILVIGLLIAGAVLTHGIGLPMSEPDSLGDNSNSIGIDNTTATPTDSQTSTPTTTPTDTSTATSTESPTPTRSPTPTSTENPTPTESPTPTDSSTQTPTDSPAATESPTPTETPSPTPTPTPDGILPIFIT